MSKTKDRQVKTPSRRLRLIMSEKYEIKERVTDRGSTGNTARVEENTHPEGQHRLYNVRVGN